MKVFRRLRQAVVRGLINSNLHFKLGLIGVIVGLTSGFAALGLNFGLHFFAHRFSAVAADWWSILLPPAGLILTVILLKYIIKDFDGHGLPEVIHSISLKGGALRLRSSFSKLLGSLITISFGGSAGPEAPVVVSGSSIGSNFARFFQSDDKTKIAVSGAGAAAAIAAIFNAPITGIIFTMEVIIGEWAAVYMLPVVIASVTATELSRIFNGNQIPFSHSSLEILPNDIFLSIGLAFLTAMLSVLFIRTLRFTAEQLQEKIPNALLKALSTGLLIGMIIFFMPQVRGEGYKMVEALISGNYQGTLRLLVLIVLFKIIATSLTLNGGGAGGVFAPALLIGSTGGILYFEFISMIIPQMSLSHPGLYALMGMAGVISGTLAAPLTGIFLIVEITGAYNAVLPLMLISFLSSTMARRLEKHSIYHHELVSRGHLHRPRTDGRILADIHIEELLEKDMISISPQLLLKDMIPIIKKSRRNYFPVIDPDSKHFRGIITFNDLKEFIFSPQLANSIFIEEIMDRDIISVSPNDTLMDIQDKFDQTRLWSLPVVKDNKFLGLISKATMLDLYRKELKVQTDR